MTPLSPTALEEAANKLDPDAFAVDEFGSYALVSAASRRASARTHATAAITAYLSQREKEGFVMVPVDRISAIWKEAEDCVPTNWCDGLLTGPKASRVPLDCPAVERLLLGIIKRIRDKAAAAQNGGE